MSRRVFALLILASCVGLLPAADIAEVDRTIVKQPAYESDEPGYALLTFGSPAKDRVWLVWDGESLHVDRNGNGDLTDSGEKVAAERLRPGWAKEEGYTFHVGELTVGGRTHKGLVVQLTRLERFPTGTFNERPDVQAVLAKDPQAMTMVMQVDAELPGAPGGGIGGRRTFTAGPIDLGGVLQFAPRPADAPVIRIGGPLVINFCFERPKLRLSRESEFRLVVGTPGAGPGTFARLAYDGTIPKNAHPLVEIAFAPAKPGDSPVKESVELKERCCTDTLWGAVRTAPSAAAGPATVTLSYPAWGEGRVASTTHEIKVLPAVPGAKPEPVATNLVASLGHPDRRANLFDVQFSPDGQRLFASGYPSGVVQIWDWAAKTEVYRVDTPPGSRGSAKYALLTPDWKTLYVPVDTRTVKPIERDGKRMHRIEYAGDIHVWDVSSGKEQAPLNSSESSAPVHTVMSPDGRSLVSIERPSYDAGLGTQVPKDTTVVWDLAGRQKRKLCEGFAIPHFSPDGKTVGVSVADYEAKKSVVKLLDLAAGDELASALCPDPDRQFRIADISPDGCLVAVHLGGKLAAPCEVWLLDGKTLMQRGRFLGDGNEKGYGWSHSKFSPDSRSLVILDGVGRLHVWDALSAKVIRTFEVGAGLAQQLAFSPDGATVAVARFPPFDPALARASDPDPRDLPQPRITLLNLAGTREPRVLISRHGFVGGLAFSPDGKTLAFGSAGAVHLFDLAK
jgi:WD40 repeat protein